MLEKRYNEGKTIGEFIDAATENQDLWRSYYDRAEIPESILARVRALPGVWHLLVLAEDWCGDAFNSVPYLAKLADQVDNVDLRILERDQNLDIMDRYLTNGGRSIPKVIVLDAEWTERGHWGPRPAELQRWFLEVGKAMEFEERLLQMRRWYARDRGASTLKEVVELLESLAAANATAS